MSIFTSKKPTAQQYYINDRLLKCQHCGHDLFHKRRSLLPIPPATFSDWSNRHTICYECSTCAFLHWFAERQES